MSRNRRRTRRVIALKPCLCSYVSYVEPETMPDRKTNPDAEVKKPNGPYSGLLNLASTFPGRWFAVMRTKQKPRSASTNRFRLSVEGTGKTENTRNPTLFQIPFQYPKTAGRVFTPIKEPVGVADSEDPEFGNIRPSLDLLIKRSH